MWEIYDELISKIPDDLEIQEVVVGTSWTMVKAKDNTGVAMTVNESKMPISLKKPIIGAKLKDIAMLIKSWNFIEASIGLAAINAFYNSMENLEKIKGSFKTLLDIDAFNIYSESIKDKKVVVVGHFPYIEERLGENNNLIILERKPREGDYPDSACEYVMEDADYVFITGSAFINKTMPRLLKLSENAKVILVGPSVPIDVSLFSYGVFELSSFVVRNQKLCMESIATGNLYPLFLSGNRISLKNYEER